MRRQAQASIAAHRLTPGSSPRSPIVGRVKAPVVTEDALVEHLSVDVGFPPAVAQLYADALRAGGYGSVAALANLSLDTLRTELGFKLGHIKRIQQHREELLARTLRDSPEPPQSPPRSPQSTPQSPRSPRLDDSVLEQYMFATHSREQQVEKELMTLREDLGTVLGELAALKASHAELKRRQQQPQPPPQQQQPEPEPEPEPEPRPCVAVPDAVAAPGATARDGIGDAPRGAAVEVDMQRLEEAWLDVDEQRCESQLLLQAREIFLFQEFLLPVQNAAAAFYQDKLRTDPSETVGYICGERRVGSLREDAVVEVLQKLGLVRSARTCQTKLQTAHVSSQTPDSAFKRTFSHTHARGVF